MARQMITETYSDLSGDAGASPFTFSLQGDAYSIDLTGAESRALRDALAPYVAKARKVKAPASVASTGARRPKNPGVYGKVKAWALANGHTVSDRGRPSKALVTAYEEATGEKLSI